MVDWIHGKDLQHQQFGTFILLKISINPLHSQHQFTPLCHLPDSFGRDSKIQKQYNHVHEHHQTIYTRPPFSMIIQMSQQLYFDLALDTKLLIQQQQSVNPKFFGSSYGLRILNKIVKVGCIYSFPPFYSIQSHSFCYFFNWYVLYNYFH